MNIIPNMDISSQWVGSNKSMCDGPPSMKRKMNGSRKRRELYAYAGLRAMSLLHHFHPHVLLRVCAGWRGEAVGAGFVSGGVGGCVEDCGRPSGGVCDVGAGLHFEGHIETQTKLTATLDERQRIARELHDTLEQDLMGVTLLLDDTAERLENGDAGEPLNIARRLLRRSREESRSTIRDLRSVALEQLGLPAAIEDTLQPIAAAARLPLKFTTTGEPRKLPTLVESSLLRIAHEALSNVVKHARADHAEIHLEYTAADVRLTITDHGAGFVPGDVDARAGHFGLQGIRERVNKISGTLQIDSHPGTGTAIRITVPLS